MGSSACKLDLRHERIRRRFRGLLTVRKLLHFALAIVLGAALGTGIEQAYSTVTTTSAANPINNLVGGSINNTPIGATTPSTGAFTTLTTTGNVIVGTGGGASITVGATAIQTGAFLGIVNTGDAIEWGHTNTAGYRSHIGAEAGSGVSFVALHAEAGTNSNSYKTRGIKGSVLRSDVLGGFVFSSITNASADNQTPTDVATITTAGLATFTGGVKGSVTNDSATAGSVGEMLTTTVASGSAVSLTTATSANIATLSLTAGDWDCSAQVTHNAAATTSVTLLQIGISATTATLPTQAGGSGIGTDPLAIFRQAAAVPGGALTTNVGPVRVSLSGTTNIFLVANDTFTVSTMTGYGTIRCRRMR
jgi:hypothetical protein